MSILLQLLALLGGAASIVCGVVAYQAGAPLTVAACIAAYCLCGAIFFMEDLSWRS